MDISSLLLSGAIGAVVGGVGVGQIDGAELMGRSVKRTAQRNPRGRRCEQ